MLANITVGYMDGQSEQWLLVRNDGGAELLKLLGDEIRTEAPGSKGKRFGPVNGYLKNVKLAASGLPLRCIPDWALVIVGWLMPHRACGLEFARARRNEVGGDYHSSAPRTTATHEDDDPQTCVGAGKAVWISRRARGKTLVRVGS